MTNSDNPEGLDLDVAAEGDDAFAGGVGDALPGMYRGRHARAAAQGAQNAQSAQGAQNAQSTHNAQSTQPRVTRERTAAAYGVDEPSGPIGTTPAEDSSATAEEPTVSATQDADADTGASGQASAPSQDSEPQFTPMDFEAVSATDATDASSGDAAGAPGSDARLAADRLADLQRLQAEYVNYKKRVDRDRDVQRQLAISGVLESLLPVLDDIHFARQHGELETGPFAKIAEKLENVLVKQGVTKFGQPGDTFDPTVHQAIMHTEAELAPGTTDTTVVQVMQPGYKLGDRIVRPAMVAVADPS